MTIVHTANGSAITLSPDESLSQAFIISVLNENGQILPDAAADWVDLLFEALEDHDGQDLAEVQQ